MLFTARHYRQLAATVASLPLSDADTLTVARHFANHFALDNDRFSREVFVSTVGILRGKPIDLDKSH